MNKKILILANLDIGLYKFRKALIKELIDQGNEVYISLPKGMLVQNLKEMGCHFIETPVDRRGINPATDLKLMMRYFNIIGKIKPDLVIPTRSNQTSTEESQQDSKEFHVQSISQD